MKWRANTREANTGARGQIWQVKECQNLTALLFQSLAKSALQTRLAILPGTGVTPPEQGMHELMTFILSSHLAEPGQKYECGAASFPSP